MKLLDGKAVSAAMKLELAEEVRQLTSSTGIIPHLAAILVGDDGAAQTYVGNKVKSCAEVGFKSSLIQFPNTVTQEEIIQKIREINTDDSIHGLIVQLPLPEHISEQKIVEEMAPDKDVDGFHPINLGKMALELPCHLPATPYGILMLMQRGGVVTKGKHCVILGRSHIAGSPMSILLSRKSEPGDCTVTLCHSRTPDIRKHTLQADILITALGRPGYLTADMVKEGAVVIDIGITRVKADNKSGYRIVGDVDFEHVAPKCSMITPVPGGVGPMTIIGLLTNTLSSAKNAANKR
jgi:methylenetetrahydrofolate dehydrogenase (NADP+)/methenyltetrahydrofolate cyclohydrolase